MKPLGQRVLVQRIAAPEKTETGLYIPSVAKATVQMGEVLAVGEKCELGLKHGDKVLLPKFGGIEYQNFVVYLETEIPLKL